MDKKVARKLQKMKDRLAELENTLLTAVTKKDSKSAEINVPQITNQINTLRREIKELEK